jgi:hypothetical protein
VKRHGLMGMMSNQKPSLHNGSQKCNQDPKGTASSVKYEGDVNFLYISFIVRWYSPRIFNLQPDCQKDYYLEVMEHLQEAVRRKRPDVWRHNRCMFLHDNAPAHSSLLICFIEKKFGNFVNSPCVCRLIEKWCLNFSYLWLTRNILTNET